VVAVSAWTSDVPVEAGFYWVRWRRDVNKILGELDGLLVRMGKTPPESREQLSNPSYVRGVISVRFGPRGGKKPWRWVEPVRRHYKPPDGAFDVEYRRAEVQPLDRSS